MKKALSKLSIDGLSVDERLRNFFESYAGVGPEQAAALDDLVDLSGEAYHNMLMASDGRARSFTSEADALLLQRPSDLGSG